MGHPTPTPMAGPLSLLEVSLTHGSPHPQPHSRVQVESGAGSASRRRAMGVGVRRCGGPGLDPHSLPNRRRDALVATRGRVGPPRIALAARPPPYPCPHPRQGPCPHSYPHPCRHSCPHPCQQVAHRFGLLSRFKIVRRRVADAHDHPTRRRRHCPPSRITSSSGGAAARGQGRAP